MQVNKFGGLKKIFSKEILKVLFIIPLFLSIRPRSYIAHDEGYYILQSRAILDSGNWLAPVSWGTPVFDRTIGIQWMIAGCQKIFGYTSWSSHIPSLIFGLISLCFTYLLSKRYFGVQVASISAGILLLSPIFFDHIHLATQDMPLLAIELIGIYSIAKAEKEKSDVFHVISGVWMGIGFLIKGFMIFLPVMAIIPFILWRKRYLLSSKLFLIGFVVGCLPAFAWISLSINEYGYEVVSNLLHKLLYLSGENIFAKGPFYYMWNIPLFTLPWFIFAIHPLVYGIKNWRDERLFVFIGYPLLLAFLLSCFKTKTTYYGLQLTPYISILAAYSAVLFSTHHAVRRRLIGFIKILGICFFLGAVTLLLMRLNGFLVVGPYIFVIILFVLLALSITWILLDWRESGYRIFARLLLCQWVVMVVLTQGGLLTDRNPLIRNALSNNYDVMQIVKDQRVSFVKTSSGLEASDSKKRILIALAMKNLNHSLISNESMSEGDLAWINKRDIHLLPPGNLSILYSNNDLFPWVLVAKN